jgi:hypothetical protein
MKILLTEEDLHEAIRDLVKKRRYDTSYFGEEGYSSQLVSRPKSLQELAAKPGSSVTFEVHLESLKK